MAKLALSLILIFSCSMFAAMPTGGASPARKSWFKNICQGNEKLAELHVYVHEIISTGPNQTAYEVSRASITSDSPTAFGRVVVADDVLTAEPDINSEVVGKVQGFTVSVDMETRATALNGNFVFTTGKYNGSTISILGRIKSMEREREVLVVGGTGFFRGTRGYAVARTYSNDVEAGYFVVEYTFYATYVDA